VLAIGFFVPAGPTNAKTYELNPVRLYMFHLDTCSRCHDEHEFLEKVAKKLPHLEVVEFEVSQKNFQNRSFFSNVIQHYELEGGGVPVTVIGDQLIVGFDDEKGKGVEILQQVAQCSTSVCESWIDDTQGSVSTEKVSVNEKTLKTLGIDPAQLSTIDDQPNQVTQNPGQNNQVRVFGREFNLENQSSTMVIGIILGLADGINPCMFSVLIFLLTYLMAIGSRKKALKAGIIFTVTTFAVYFLFMLGIIKVVDILGVAYWFRWIVIFFALFAGIVMIKDYFFYGKWFSLEIPKRFRPKIQSLIKKGTLPSAFVLALLASIVELPCTSGLPLAYVTILADRQLNPVWYLLIYNFFFVLPLFVIILSVVFAWTKSEKVEEKRIKLRKYMRLVAGVLLVLMALALWQNWI